MVLGTTFHAEKINRFVKFWAGRWAYTPPGSMYGSEGLIHASRQAPESIKSSVSARSFALAGSTS